MPATLLKPDNTRNDIDPPIELERILSLLETNTINIIDGLFQGEHAQLIVDENHIFSGRSLNVTAVKVRDEIYIADGKAPPPDPINGDAILLTGPDRLP